MVFLAFSWYPTDPLGLTRLCCRFSNRKTDKVIEKQAKQQTVPADTRPSGLRVGRQRHCWWGRLLPALSLWALLFHRWWILSHPPQGWHVKALHMTPTKSHSQPTTHCSEISLTFIKHLTRTDCEKVGKCYQSTNKYVWTQIKAAVLSFDMVHKH